MSITIGGCAASTAPAGTTPTVFQKTEQHYLAASNAWLDCTFTANQLTRIVHKISKLTTLLDDPALLVSRPAGHPERAEAESRHFALCAEGKRLRDDLRRSAKAVDRAWGGLSKADRAEFVSALGDGWRDEPIVELARLDRAISPRPLWMALYAAWDGPRAEGENDEACPF